MDQSSLPGQSPVGGAVGDLTGIMDTLVRTYRELNTRFRQIDENALTSTGAKDIIRRMRRDEMLFAQALKERVSGIGTVGDTRDLFAGDSEQDTTAQLISQFGTARATTLTLLKDLSQDVWSRPLEDGMTIFDHVRDLAESDTVQLERLGKTIM